MPVVREGGHHCVGRRRAHGGDAVYSGGTHAQTDLVGCVCICVCNLPDPSSSIVIELSQYINM